MGNTILDRGLRPAAEDIPAPPADLQLEWLWVMVSFHAHQFRGRPIAEVLASWTNILLLHNGFNPTIGELAKASGLPRATISRYVSSTIQSGWAEERVDPRNRRRRELHLTEAGAKELEYIVEFFHFAFHELMSHQPDDGEQLSGDDYLNRLAEMSAKISERLIRWGSDSGR
ncbi:MAG: winged helix-turn-helix transcriptional regulator [Gammaproteobacteria bacterium]|nr:winged helix-turn-helix transcriptional regulator [Gammaproteobacteria bacterium]